MSGKQIFAVSASFIVGGILGFLLHGQLVKDNLIGSYPMNSNGQNASSPGNYNSGNGNGGSKTTFDNEEWRNKLTPQATSAIDETLEEMNLSEQQHDKIESIIERNLPPSGDFSKMSKTKMMRTAYQIRKELNPEQQKILQEAILKHANIALPEFK